MSEESCQTSSSGPSEVTSLRSLPATLHDCAYFYKGRRYLIHSGCHNYRIADCRSRIQSARIALTRRFLQQHSTSDRPFITTPSLSMRLEPGLPHLHVLQRQESDKAASSVSLLSTCRLYQHSITFISGHPMPSCFTDTGLQDP